MSAATAFKRLPFSLQEGALTALASVADASKNYFINYYDHVMPLLRGILSSGVSREEALLRAKALECISLVGMAVGKERFREDAHRVMELIRQLQVNAGPFSCCVWCRGAFLMELSFPYITEQWPGRRFMML